jgi:hypothetical protein
MLVAGRAELVEALVPGPRNQKNITPIVANASLFWLVTNIIYIVTSI